MGQSLKEQPWFETDQPRGSIGLHAPLRLCLGMSLIDPEPTFRRNVALVVAKLSDAVRGWLRLKTTSASPGAVARLVSAESPGEPRP